MTYRIDPEHREVIDVTGRDTWSLISLAQYVTIHAIGGCNTPMARRHETSDMKNVTCTKCHDKARKGNK